MARKMTTAETTFFFDISEASGNQFIDIGQVLSLANRRGSYRQGMQYVFKLEVFGTTDVHTSVAITTLPQTWVAANAWKKSYSLWQESQDQVLDIEPSVAAKWRDFKIYMDDTHRAAGFAANLIPIGYASNGVANSVYDWEVSTIQMPNYGGAGITEEFTMHMIGDDNTGTADDSKGLIHGYALARSRPQTDDPNVPISRGWMNMLFDVGDNLNEIREDVTQNNDEPPYLLGEESTVLEFYPGGEIQASTLASYTRDILSVRAGSGSVSSDTSAPLVANCGLVHLNITGGSVMVLTVAQGDHHGIMARPMQDVN